MAKKRAEQPSTDDKVEPRVLPPTAYLNQFVVRAGQNLSNHVLSLSGLGKFVAFSSPSGRGDDVVVVRTRQEAYRLVAWLLVMVDAHALPDERPTDLETGMILAEEEPYTYEEIEAHVHNS